MNFHKSIGLFFLAAFFLLFISCSSDEPVSPGFIPDQRRADTVDGHIMPGAWRIIFIPGEDAVTIIPLRTGESHYDVTKFLFPPYCGDCFSLSNMVWDWDSNTLSVDVTVKNFTALLTGYDVRGIVYLFQDYVLKNAHAYTLLHAPPGVLDVSGFRAFDTADPDRSMLPAEFATETFIIEFPPGAGFIDMIYAVDASWPDHCHEPYDITGFTMEKLDIIPGSTANMSVYVSDWQDDVQKVTINTDLLGGGEISLTNSGSGLWTGEIENILGIPVGLYPALITARDAVSIQNLYQWVNIQVYDLSDADPPTWDIDEGITSVFTGLQGVLVNFGTASDPSTPVTYNLYWVEGGTLDFGTANVVSGLEESPYLLEGLNPTLHTLCVRAEDSLGNETTNVVFENADVGVHPNVHWTDGPDMKVPRGYSGSFVYENGFWVLGGSNITEMLSTVEMYDILTGEWSQPWSLPDPRDSFGCGAVALNAYVFGGRTAETSVTDYCWIIDIATGAPLEIVLELPEPRAGMGCALMDDTFFLAGGRNWTGSEWEYHRDAHKLVVPSTIFEGVTDLEYDTAMMGFASGDGYLMTCGGYLMRTEVLYHEPETKSWNYQTPLIIPVQGNVSVLVDDWFYSIGGEIGMTMSADVNVFDVAGNEWYTLNPLNGPRGYATASTDGTHIYVAGGIYSAGPAYIPLGTLEIGKIF